MHADEMHMPDTVRIWRELMLTQKTNLSFRYENAVYL